MQEFCSRCSSRKVAQPAEELKQRRTGEWDKNMERPDPREEAKGAVKQEAEKIRKQTGGERRRSPQLVTKWWISRHRSHKIRINQGLQPIILFMSRPLVKIFTIFQFMHQTCRPMPLLNASTLVTLDFSSDALPFRSVLLD